MEYFPDDEVREIIDEYGGEINLGSLSNELNARGYFTKGIKTSLESLSYSLEFLGEGSYLVSCGDGNENVFSISEYVNNEYTESTIKGFINERGGEIALGLLSSLLVNEGYETKGIMKNYLKKKSEVFKFEDRNGLGDYVVWITTQREHVIDQVNTYFLNIETQSSISGVSTNLGAIQAICKELLGKTPNSVREGKRMLESIYVNIFDYVEKKKGCIMFSTLRQLRRYSIRNRKLFPRHEAKSEGLRFLLKNFFSRS